MASQTQHKGQGDQAVVAVGVHEVVVGYALGIIVVLTKGADEVGAYDGGFGGAEIVGQEVYKPRKKIRGKVGCDRQDGQQPRVSEARHSSVHVLSEEHREHEEGEDP